SIGPARGNHAAETDVTAGQRLQLERDMLQNVRDVGSFFQPFEEPARLLSGAVMLGERRNRLRQSLVESRYVGRADLLERAQLNVAGNYRGEARVIRAP